MTDLSRRAFGALTVGGVLAAASARARSAASGAPSLPLGAPSPFSVDGVVALARALAAEDYGAAKRVPDAWADLSYDDYRRLGFDVDRAPLRGDVAHIELFAPGLYFIEPVEINLVADGAARPVLFDPVAFRVPDDLAHLRDVDPGGYSGFKVVDAQAFHDGLEEYLVFQGASYFRARGIDDVYGLSARGLAIDTGEAGGEEFPAFRRFWIERPSASGHVRVHALLDSPSCTGAFSFEARLGRATEMDVSARIFPRRDMPHVGIAAQTSMFLFDQTNRSRFDDFRAAVHDSDGLLIDNGAGERLWRPLANPRELQVSQFLDEGPAGFGLMQRARDLADFEDFEALYHRRPGLWVTPKQDWGRGSVALVEIPTDKEIYDNVVAYWRPAEHLAAGSEYRFDYGLTWGPAPEPTRDVAMVADTYMGERLTGPDQTVDGERVVIDFAPHARLSADIGGLRAFVGTNRGFVSEPLIQRHPETGAARLVFHFKPGDLDAMELRAQILDDGGPASEVWLYRWTRGTRKTPS